jgi:iron complex outermembrane receptor protein
VARAFRYPTFTERYYDPGGTPSLSPEDGWTVEGGPSLRIVRSHTLVQADATVFATRLTDKLVWQPSYVTSGVQVWSPSNVSRVYSRGLELSLRAQTHVQSSLQLSGGTLFTHTRAENRANPNSPAHGAQLPYVPTQTLKIWGQTQWKDLSLSASGRLVGVRYYSSDESNALPPYQTLNVRAAYNWRLADSRLSIEMQIENVLNERYQVVRLYPMPPRHATLRLQLALPTD